MKAHALAVLLLVHCGGSSSQPASASDQQQTTTASTASAPATTTAPAATTTATPATAGASIDLSTEDKARASILDALKRGDKDTFKKCVSQRILKAHAADFDAWYGVWKTTADQHPTAFTKITVSKESADWKLDEN